MSDLPYSDSVDLTDATTQAGEPQFCYAGDKTAWYAVTATRDGTLAAGSTSSTAYAQVTAYGSDGTGIGGLTFLSCQNLSPSKAVFAVQAGETYYLQVSTFFGTSGTVRLDLEEQLPPPNDDFADATRVTSAPFSGSVDMTASTVEDGESTTCQGTSPRQTAWYAFTRRRAAPTSPAGRASARSRRTRAARSRASARSPAATPDGLPRRGRNDVLPAALGLELRRPRAAHDRHRSGGARDLLLAMGSVDVRHGGRSTTTRPTSRGSPRASGA